MNTKAKSNKNQLTAVTIMKTVKFNPCSTEVFPQSNLSFLAPA